MRWFPMIGLFLIGCGGPAPIAPGTDVRDAARVFALARDHEVAQKSKQAMAAYRQVVLHFPDTPEARQASWRISEAQRAAIRKVAARKSR
jgi:hypothetical protein